MNKIPSFFSKRFNPFCLDSHDKCRKIVRPHPMHEMRTIATDDPVAWCESVCPHCACALQKRLNGSTSCMGWRLLGTVGTLYIALHEAAPSHPQRRQGDSKWPLPNYFGQLCCRFGGACYSRGLLAERVEGGLFPGILSTSWPFYTVQTYWPLPLPLPPLLVYKSINPVCSSCVQPPGRSACLESPQCDVGSSILLFVFKSKLHLYDLLWTCCTLHLFDSPTDQNLNNFSYA